jgi:hypothetical protein
MVGSSMLVMQDYSLNVRLADLFLQPHGNFNFLCGAATYGWLFVSISFLFTCDFLLYYRRQSQQVVVKKMVMFYWKEQRNLNKMKIHHNRTGFLHSDTKCFTFGFYIFKWTYFLHNYL